ncbi:MAG: helix-turn-helix domain-containing protein [Clostridia bacterium]|nr:helix-turn-helix domain-containing protein [Clostridia bacterium]
MKILYKQSGKNERENLLASHGIEDCYLKRIVFSKDNSSITKKSHSHRGYEIHIIEVGSQKYEIGEKIYELSRGDVLLIPPRVPHKVVHSSSDAVKYSFALSILKNSGKSFDEADPTVEIIRVGEDMIESLESVYREYNLKKELSLVLIENRVFEILVSIFRRVGFEERAACGTSHEENAKLELAKGYINDNIDERISVGDVASYCYLGEKQLGRLFLRYEGVTVAAYIRNRKTERVEKLLSDESLSLKQVAEMMSFNNEYYFNAYFKKYYGMPPGEFRKTLKQ